MKASEILPEIIDNYKLRISSLILGSPGIGKSDLVRQAAKLLGISLIDERLSQLDPVDLRGIPSIENGITKFNIPDMLPRVDRDGEHGMLFLDEITSCVPAMQAAAYQLTLDRKCGNYILPDGWSVVAAGNLAADRAIVQRMSTALSNRFGHYEMEVDVNDWLDWANENNIHTELIQFIRFRGIDLLHDMDVDKRAFPTPRSWCFVDKHIDLATPQNELHKYQAFVGSGAATEFISFLKVYRELPTFDDIIQNPKTARISDDPATMYAITGLLMKNTDATTFDVVMKYTDRLPAEYQAMFVQHIIKHKSELAKTDTFVKWATDNAQKLI